MLGLFIYTFCSLGLAGLFPSPSKDGRTWLGLSGFAGFCSIGILIFILNTLIGIGLTATCGAVFAISSVGWVRLALVVRHEWRLTLLHPTVLLITAGFGVAAWRGGIGYLPYSGDEFAQWIGAARAIFVAGGYPNAFNLVAYPGYTPGWALTLLFPMVPAGGFDEGLAASAPFVMYAFLLGFIYESLTALLARHSPLSDGMCRFYACAAVMALIAVEINGRLVSINLLIEPAQIYTGSAIFLLLMLMFEGRERNFGYPIFIGIICLASYLYKMAALTLAPSLALSALALFWVHTRNEGRENILGVLMFSLIALALMAGPMALVHVIWKAHIATGNCLASPFALLQENRLNDLVSDENIRMTGAFVDKFWNYVSSYKWPLSVLACLGFAVGVFRSGCWPAIIAFIAYFAAMEMAFYLVMAVCGHWQYMTTERYTRVILQPAHILGLIVIIGIALREAESRKWNWLYDLLTSRAVQGSVAVFIVALFSWQVVHMDRAFEDLQYRHIQKTDFRHKEISDAMAKLGGAIAAGEIKIAENRVPKVLLIDDYWEDLSHSLATYHALGNQMGAGRRFAEILIWNKQTTSDSKAEFKALSMSLAEADIIWPVKMPLMISIRINAYLDGTLCGGDVKDYYLIRLPGERIRFSCMPKKRVD